MIQDHTGWLGTTLLSSIVLPGGSTDLSALPLLTLTYSTGIFLAIFVYLGIGH